VLAWPLALLATATPPALDLGLPRAPSRPSPTTCCPLVHSNANRGWSTSTLLSQPGLPLDSPPAPAGVDPSLPRQPQGKVDALPIALLAPQGFARGRRGALAQR
jgi:hypothetical protein